MQKEVGQRRWLWKSKRSSTTVEKGANEYHSDPWDLREGSDCSSLGTMWFRKMFSKSEALMHGVMRISVVRGTSTPHFTLIHSFIHLFNHSFNTYLLSPCSAPVTRHTAVHKNEAFPILRNRLSSKLQIYFI